jgi:hypothetical protein
MRINWVFADSYQLDPTIDLDRIKAVGPSWGSWTTWRSCGTDNVICNDRAKANDLLKRAFQAVCNFYVPRKYYQDLGRPVGIKMYEGDFIEEPPHAEDIVGMHLASTQSDIILLVGFDFSSADDITDKMKKHNLKNYYGLARSLIASNDQVQWVLVDHNAKMDKLFDGFDNLAKDSMTNALQLLV